MNLKDDQQRGGYIGGASFKPVQPATPINVMAFCTHTPVWAPHRVPCRVRLPPRLSAELEAAAVGNGVALWKTGSAMFTATQFASTHSRSAGAKPVRFQLFVVKMIGTLQRNTSYV